ncbi:thiamine phosphate synthase [Thioalkalivibrio sp. ALE20]|uniref:thiamine phosphate synthase n=1 Tax=Thioalkalivibrio sp. ALE20 TaxID=545275 RepID=UPI00036BA7A3|nr:thiamine phosphate synthase [Thioalkalivibrio sp. ALE20]
MTEATTEPVAERAPLRGLYFVTPAPPPGADPLPAHTDAAAAALAGGACCVQLRDKYLEGEAQETVARALARLCHDHGAYFIVNDDVELAARIGADGVHLGRDDPDPAGARARLGDAAVIGVSCYNELARARAAQAAGADYVAFGSMFPSPTKPEAVRATPELIRQARRELAVAICAIGGITADNAAQVVAAGADMVAVIQGISAAPDPEAAARRIATLFQTT